KPSLAVGALSFWEAPVRSRSSSPVRPRKTRKAARQSTRTSFPRAAARVCLVFREAAEAAARFSPGWVAVRRRPEEAPAPSEEVWRRQLPHQQDPAQR